ncbi:MAG: gamma-glutamylcyclotransferase family protein, partial [Bacteroidota bacterium]
LRANSQFIAKGKMNGKLYDLGSYPAAVFEPNGEEEVLGNIFELKDEKYTLAVLDEYEGTEYTREQVLIQSEKGEYQCWVYLYQLPTAGLNLIASGNYLDHLSNPDSKHWEFIRSV